MESTRIFARGGRILLTLAATVLPLTAGTVQDLGAVAQETPQSVSIIFKLRNQAELEHFISRSVDPQAMGFRNFMDTREFAENFGPRPWDLVQVLQVIDQLGITVNGILDDRMVIKATGTTAQFNALLGTELHQYREGGRNYQKPNCKPTLPATIQDLVLMVAGLDSQSQAKAHHVTTARTEALAGLAQAMVLPPAGATATGAPGSFTVGDVANLYNINPLYQHRITGKGRTLGIATLASFDPADAYAYWSAIGLQVDPHRIHVIPVDGGAGTDGADETTLDVEQAGGLAYQASVFVYEAPNTDAGFLDLFYQAVSENRVDSLSVSWGLGEEFRDNDTLAAFHQVFLEAAAQGIPLFASAGDNGAFDMNGPLPTPFWAPVNSVDHPASDPYVTAAGGVTLPVTLVARLGTIVVPQERAWGWDYLENYFVTNYGQFYYDSKLFPVGGGGGVSSVFPVPAWQIQAGGAQLTPAADSEILFYPNYTATDPDTSGAVDYGPLPPGYAGRNLPDVALNADPFTGYLLYFGGAFYNGYGGTSFVAPQLNGITTLLTQAAGGRVGYLNPQLYRQYLRFGQGAGSPFQAVTAGDNLFWAASTGYNPATGLGTLDVTRLVQRLADPF
jgi:subtilase family serine protease